MSLKPRHFTAIVSRGCRPCGRRVPSILAKNWGLVKQCLICSLPGLSLLLAQKWRALPVAAFAGVLRSQWLACPSSMGLHPHWISMPAAGKLQSLAWCRGPWRAWAPTAMTLRLQTWKLMTSLPLSTWRALPFLAAQACGMPWVPRWEVGRAPSTLLWLNGYLPR